MHPKGLLMRRCIVGFCAALVVVVLVMEGRADEPRVGKAEVSGVFKGNGKDSKLAFVSAQWREPFNDKPSIRLVFTEKDHSRDPKPDFNAAFGRYGSALIVSLHE